MRKTAEITQRKQYGDKYKHNPLSADSFRRYRENLAKVLKNEVLKELIWCVRFVLQWGESTDVCNISVLMEFATWNTEWTSF